MFAELKIVKEFRHMHVYCKNDRTPLNIECRVRLDCDMCPDTYLNPLDHFKPVLGFVFIIFQNFTFYPLFSSMDFRGPWGSPNGVFTLILV